MLTRFAECQTAEQVQELLDEKRFALTNDFQQRLYDLQVEARRRIEDIQAEDKASYHFIGQDEKARPCILRDEATGIEIAGQGRLIHYPHEGREVCVAFTAEWDALPEKTRQELIEQYGERKARHDWSRVLIHAPVEQVHWIED